MEKDQVQAILERVAVGELTPDAALQELRWAPFEDLEFARIDTHRQLRTGAPEVIFCPGKTVEQVVEIVRRLAERSSFVLATRASAEQAAALRAAFPAIIHHEAARVLELRPASGDRDPTPTPARKAEHEREGPQPPAPYILVVSAGTSDIPVAEEAAVTARALGSRVERLFDVGVAGLHRLLDRRDLLLGANALVVVAGMEGALPSVVAGLVERPVIAVPTSVGYGAHFGGLAPLLAMLNSCATGVAVVNIDNGFGAGTMAHLINQGSGVRGQGSEGGQASAPDAGTKGGAVVRQTEGASAPAPGLASEERDTASRPPCPGGTTDNAPGMHAQEVLGKAGASGPPCPGGTADNSPGIHAWEAGSPIAPSPGGTTENSPGIHAWEARPTTPLVPEGRQNASDQTETNAPSLRAANPTTSPEERPPIADPPPPPTEVTVLEANLDDLNPQVYDYVMERLFAAGALDVTLTPIHMKKNRPAVTLSVIAHPAQAGTLAEVLFAETSTLGVRMSRWERLCLEREWVQAETPWGPIRVKIGRRHGRVLTRTPEYEDCKRVAQEAGVPLKEVQAAALAAVGSADG